MNQILRKKLKILVLLALADKEFADLEREFIEKICLSTSPAKTLTLPVSGDPRSGMTEEAKSLSRGATEESASRGSVTGRPTRSSRILGAEESNSSAAISSCPQTHR